MKARWLVSAMIAAMGTAIVLVPGSAARADLLKAKVDLAATAVAPAARGKARVAVRHASKGTFDVSAQRLQAQSDYDLVIGGIKVATLHTNRGGAVHVRFSSLGRRRDLLLGFDPRGAAVEVRDASGNDVLTGTLPQTTPENDAAKVACCKPDDGRFECDDRTPEDCAAQGGTVADAPSCLPNPCGATPPVGTAVVCCVPDDTGLQCEDRTQADCTTAGGTLVEASSCTPNPCVATPAPPDTHVQCCVAAYYVWACEDHTVAECQALGGIDKGPGACAPNPCGDVPPSRGHGICCLPNAAGSEVECEDRAASACVTAGGVVKSGQVCDPTTCADVLPPNPAVMCCLPNAAGDEIECEDRTASDCSAANGISKGAGVCALDTCADVPPPSPDVMCCMPKSNGEVRCEDRSAGRCLAGGGAVIGAGSCPAVDPCR